ncbi:hypothetical protein CB0940_03535 [Cercospora beticola]|uniref:Uncharacterized protein n=1 Tax=Cercospora beticola TaxID=122368 RepID=A0A2G5I3E7_CERBT|nr:hypothetical protein CB0940_03535 [Cercospora beticola]PIA99319.1 hypothetical protein CB0940_03535 [Cercospora beticola]WPB00709.1 hypothetical protein RHO25_005329 [Cercospora beticola]
MDKKLIQAMEKLRHREAEVRSILKAMVADRTMSTKAAKQLRKTRATRAISVDDDDNLFVPRGDLDEQLKTAELAVTEALEKVTKWEKKIEQHKELHNVFWNGFNEYTEQMDEVMYRHICCNESDLVAKSADELFVYFNELRTFPKKYADLVQDTILKAGRTPNQVNTSALGLLPETADTGDDMSDAEEEDDDVGFQRYENDED